MRSVVAAMVAPRQIGIDDLREYFSMPEKEVMATVSSKCTAKTKFSDTGDRIPVAKNPGAIPRTHDGGHVAYLLL